MEVDNLALRAATSSTDLVLPDEVTLTAARTGEANVAKNGYCTTIYHLRKSEG